MEMAIHWVFHKETKLVQYKAIMDKCWVAHSEFHKEANLGIMKYQVKSYQAERLREGHL